MAKTSIDQWDASAGNNTDVAGINIDEGMAPSDVNNALRAMMAQLKAWYDQTHVGKIGFFAYADPAGNWLECDGSAYDSVTNTEYAALYAKIGTTFGGSGPIDFQVPDLRGRSPMGAGQGETAEGGGTGTSRALGDVVGQESDAHVHSGGSHTHGVGTLAVGPPTGGSGDGDAQDGTGVTFTYAKPGHAHGLTGDTAAGGTEDTGSTAVDTVSPATVLKCYIGY